MSFHARFSPARVVSGGGSSPAICLIVFSSSRVVPRTFSSSRILMTCQGGMGRHPVMLPATRVHLPGGGGTGLAICTFHAGFRFIPWWGNPQFWTRRHHTVVLSPRLRGSPSTLLVVALHLVGVTPAHLVPVLVQPLGEPGWAWSRLAGPGYEQSYGESTDLVPDQHDVSEHQAQGLSRKEPLPGFGR